MSNNSSQLSKEAHYQMVQDRYQITAKLQNISDYRYDTPLPIEYHNYHNYANFTYLDEDDIERAISTAIVTDYIPIDKNQQANESSSKNEEKNLQSSKSGSSSANESSSNEEKNLSSQNSDHMKSQLLADKEKQKKQEQQAIKKNDFDNWTTQQSGMNLSWQQYSKIISPQQKQQK